ncbi:MAG: Deoxyribose-phosphate aldolase [Alphaproteobacteria bacterium MarineAlpha5_Bin5]|nr:MAG: Deoxyribose-phosphate aldolase [Alphaproteobacteria bacterium MarineAlpha5_Bin5]PPR52265.1 MAG: Deoxyribose-phosphate aldolase [Alphaproteobacteria bacterium MarineAlpha5_Bin4]|tara:strand:- start:14152 stop:15078 length:927 start_codon:yes stop_codon:yes gene_type:complete
MKLDLNLINNIKVNLSAIERRTSSITKRRSVKKEFQAAWLLKAITLIDLTTLSGDDTFGKLERLCEKARKPISLDLQNHLEVNQDLIKVAAVCVYHHLVSEAKRILPKNIPVAAVSTGFPAGLSSFKTRKLEIIESIKNGADEIDIVINRGFVLQNKWDQLYKEVKDFKLAAKNKHIKAILGVGDLETLRNVAKASMVCMMAGADFIKTSTGKELINANLNNSLVMLRMIRQFYEMTGKKIGFKPAGGISTAKTVVEFLILVKEELGNNWINPKLLRIGASSLLIDIERQLYHYALGRYANKDKLALG